MKKRQIGSSDLHVSEYTLGCMSLGTDKKHASYIIDQAIDSGINHLDTADLYDFGQNEEIVGQAIKDKRQEIIITSKVGNHLHPKTKEYYWDPSKEYIEKAIKDSLRRLETDYIDLYLLHGGTIDDPKDETIAAFESLKKAGYIRAYGISSIRPNVIDYYIKHASIDAIMMQYSLLDRRPEELFEQIKRNNVSVLARGPLAKGILTNHAKPVMDQKAADGYLSYQPEELQKVVEQLQTIGQQSLAQTAFSYVLDDPVVASAVFGVSSLGQLNELLPSMDNQMLDADQIAFIQEITNKAIYTAHRKS